MPIQILLGFGRPAPFVVMRLPLALFLVCLASCIVVPQLTCAEEESDGYVWPSKNVGESVIHYCNGEGYYRRICLFRKTASGPSASWSRLVNMCSGCLLLHVIVECKGDGVWKETPAGQYAYIECPGEYDGYIGRFCTESGEWGKTKDLCYLPSGKAMDEFEVEL